MAWSFTQLEISWKFWGTLTKPLSFVDVNFNQKWNSSYLPSELVQPMRFLATTLQLTLYLSNISNTKYLAFDRKKVYLRQTGRKLNYQKLIRYYIFFVIFLPSWVSRASMAFTEYSLWTLLSIISFKICFHTFSVYQQWYDDIKTLDF